MKTYSERTRCVKDKLKTLKTRRMRIAAAAWSGTAIVLALVLFWPFSATPPDVSMYSGSDYYDVIQELNSAAYEPPAHKNNFDMLAAGMKDLFSFRDGAMAPGDMNNSEAEMNDGKYVEVTDNQVAGVTEADIIKRSDKYIFYLRNSNVKVYSIEGENSQLVGEYDAARCLYPENWEEGGFGYTATDPQMYLSEDCTVLTVIMGSYHETIGAAVLVVNLDVTDPANMDTMDYLFFTGNMISSRMVDGDILLTYNYYVRNPDFSQESTFVPSYGKPGEMELIPKDDIVCPDIADTTRYTVISRLDGKTLAVEGSTALLSYSQELYVSEDTLYATHGYTESSEKDAFGRYTQTSMTEICGISYRNGELEQLGTVTLEGSVKDQYSMDQFDGILRVVTSTNIWTRWDERISGDNIAHRTEGSDRNVNLYCVDLATWEITALVEGFAPEGEEATSVRFDGDNAYVCTAEIVTLSDPVYFFDLSDLEHITWTDTGTIDGYSTSLIQLGDGYLMGIGFGNMRQLKIEVYEEGESAVQSVCIYEREAEFAEEYKSYFIDRERDLVGLTVWNWNARCYEYILLHFDGYQLNEVVGIPLGEISNMDHTRAVLIDGWLYVLYCPVADYGNTEDTLIVEKLW